MDTYNKNSLPQNHFFLTITTLVAALGGLLFGFDTGVISGALIFIQQTYSITTLTQEIIVSSAVLGALAGALSSGRLADLFGSHRMLFYMAVTFIIGTLLSVCAGNVTVLIAGRFIIGIAIGITSYLSPLFISEMAPAHQRGKLVLLNGIMITGGEAVAFLIDYALVPTQSWRLMFAAGLVPAILLFIGMLILPASPRWTALKGETEQARKILSLIRHPQHIEEELHGILQQSKLEKHHWTVLFTKLFQPVLIVGLGLGILQQFLGISTVMYYGPSIFKAAGFQNASAQLLATFAMGVMNTVMTIIAVLIVDKVGRRFMLLSGTAIAGISLFMIGYLFSNSLESVWAIFIFLMLYIMGYCISLGSLFWLVISEIYPLNMRGFAMSLASAAQWAANFIVSMTFLSILNTIGAVYTFWIYAAMCVVSFFFCYYMVPETRGISLEHIERNLRSGKKIRKLGELLA